ncbi:14 kDa proline-rich protein DC2.15-like [Wolffia australiana]
MALKCWAIGAILLLTLISEATAAEQPQGRRQPPPPPPPPPQARCPTMPSRLRACGPVLDRLKRGLRAPRFPCCIVLDTFSAREGAACVCLAARRGILGNRVRIPQDVSRIVSFCGRRMPFPFSCP